MPKPAHRRVRATHEDYQGAGSRHRMPPQHVTRRQAAPPRRRQVRLQQWPQRL